MQRSSDLADLGCLHSGAASVAASRAEDERGKSARREQRDCHAIVERGAKRHDGYFSTAFPLHQSVVPVFSLSQK